MLRLDINLVFTVINLLVLYFFMRKFLFGRVNKILEERKALIEKQFADAKTAQDAADGMKTEYEGKLAAAQGEGEEIIARAKAEAKEQSEKLLAATDAELEQKRRRNHGGGACQRPAGYEERDRHFGDRCRGQGGRRQEHRAAG